MKYQIGWLTARTDIASVGSHIYILSVLINGVLPVKGINPSRVDFSTPKGQVMRIIDFAVRLLNKHV